MPNPCSVTNLHTKIAEALCWTVSEVRSFSLPSLRALVASEYPDLAQEITSFMQTGS